ncbi:hypothetical protein CR969_02975 [Candidatus Saccharibacteria bacterium]|nr:MAG: hypothetical protein CR969_02975 [Candidatus Saccharibacteria bacterium]
MTRIANQNWPSNQAQFITEKDFAWLKEHGVNAVRIPVGYWILDGDGPLFSSIGKLDWAVKMAKKYGLKVLIDLHAAPGSQNGQDHSGVIGRLDWYKHKTNRQKTIEILVRLAERYNDDDTVWGIELLNEPQFFRGGREILKQFYQQAYDAISKVARPGLAVVFHDGFKPYRLSGAIKPNGDLPVYMDHHWYSFVMPELFSIKLPLYFYKLRMKLDIRLTKLLCRSQPIIIGEWSGVIPGPRADKMKKSERIKLVKQSISLQQKLYKDFGGWFYWNYKTESQDVWNFRSMVEGGYLKID